MCLIENNLSVPHQLELKKSEKDAVYSWLSIIRKKLYKIMIAPCCHKFRAVKKDNK